ncbi:hypothetical protein ABB37_07312 [Leptomonas pyrrhocoris]|uniref:Uncharacterized protein n=1 Tax=Leptomonas pyrrhocoris TaxID=157538 RepID=A0A0M9FVN3_LEPPY|nr:hypothetical protein ABB37_07312 [Leptomonas pyrrhocoris]KPA76933.1 hypothetical protein ABB37_07312 [Leptomonas pyrrhocoris]|eukprot:XP_015655372.1 hypothetical protein ABB37_07312 [Leptomonas pyrrhocoris]
MPAHPSRPPPRSQSQAVSSFTPDDVTAFRLRPLGYVGTVSPFSASAPASAPGPSHAPPPPPLPMLLGASSKATVPRPHSKVVGGDAQLRHAAAAATGATAHSASYPVPHRRRGAGEDDKREGIGAIHVPRAATPCVYAALVPAAVASRSLVESTTPACEAAADPDAVATAIDTAGVVVNVSRPPLCAEATAPTEDARRFLAPSSGTIVAPNLSSAEAQELSRWTRDTATAARDAIVTATATPSKTPRKTTTVVAASALAPVETEVLHHWWRERLGVRLQHRHTNALFRELAHVLENAVRSSLTAEEAYWQQQRSETHARGIISSTPANTFVPAGKMEPLMRAVQLILHQSTVSFVEAQLSLTPTSQPLLTEHDGDDAGDGGGDDTEGKREEEVDELSHEERAEVLHTTLRAENVLVHETQTASSVLTTPSIITLPPDSLVPPPVLRLETAVGATLLARIIEQAEPCTPGMTFAKHLLHHYILPHVYLDYPAWLAVRPQMGGLSEQVTHLSTLPLRIQRQRDVVVAAAQAQGDTRYLEAVVRSWTMRSWLRSVARERQRVAQCVALEGVFDHLQGQLRRQCCFAQWQRRMRCRQQQRLETRMETDYLRFLSGSQATAGLDGVSKISTGVASSPPAGFLTWTSPPALLTSRPAGVTGPVRGHDGINVASSARSLPFSNSMATHHHRHSSMSCKKKGAGHSRVYLSFLRQRASSSRPASPPSDAPLGADAAVEGAEMAVERFVVRNSDSDMEEVDADFAAAAEAGEEDDIKGPRIKKFGLAASAASIRSGGGTSLMYLEAPRSMDDGASPTFVDVGNDSAAVSARTDEAEMTTTAVTTAAPPTIFFTMMAKLQEMEEVNTYLRRELAVHSRRLRKAEASNNGLRQRNTELTDITLRLAREKLEACNAAQKSNAIITSKNRQIRQLRSRLRAHRHRPWQQEVMRLVGDICAVSTAASERSDEVRVRQDRFGFSETEVAQRAGAGAGGAQTASDGLAKVSDTSDQAAQQQQQQQQTTTSSTVATASPTVPVDAPNEEDRLFGRIAPIVLHSTKQLPEARVILVDWANSCLDDLQLLDDLHGGALSARFGSFGEEIRNGILISRLLYYLALPRYRAQTSAAAASVDVSKANAMMQDAEESQAAIGNWTGMDPRRQLLEGQGVQLDPPYPVYEDCFKDILAQSPVDRMLQLLAFATELMTSQAGDPVSLSGDANPLEYVSAAMSTTTVTVTNTNTSTVKDKAAAVTAEKAGDTAEKKGKEVAAAAASTTLSSSTAAVPTPPSSQPAVPIPLHSVVDPYALARGESSAVVTLIALLYVRFAHPFHHKSRRSAKQERRMLLQLWSNGDATAEELAGPREEGGRERRDSGHSDASLISFVQTGEDEEERAGGGGGGKDADAHKTGAEEEGNAAARRSPSVDAANDKAAAEAAAEGTFSIEAEMLRQLAPEDKTPWQLFRERCLPVFGTQAHPFLLRGGFWPAEAFDTPELAAMLGALAMALHRSLQLHRWHVTLSCLVPVRTYSGLSRGVFTGPNASPAALQLGLRQDGQELLCLDFPLVRRRIDARQKQFEGAAAAAVAAGSPVNSPLRRGAPSALSPAATSSPLYTPGPAQDEIRALLEAVTSVWQEDLLSLFTQRATLSPQLALPILDLGGWRLLCGDLGLIDLSSLEDDEADGGGGGGGGGGPSEAPKQLSLPIASALSMMQRNALDIEIVTVIFQKAVMAVAQERDEVDPSVFSTLPRGQHLHELPSSQQQPLRANVSMEYVLGTSALAPLQSGASAELNNFGVDSSGRLLRAPHGTGDHVAVPDIQIDMTYAAFVLALALLADVLFPGSYVPRIVAVSNTPLVVPRHDDSNRKAEKVATPKDGNAAVLDPTDAPPNSFALQYCSLPMAFAEMMRCVVLTSPLVALRPNDPRSILRRLTCGLPTQMVLHRHAPALLLVFQAYSRDIFGVEGLLREDLLRLLRDAMLTNAELTQYLVFDLFASCSVLRHANEEVAVGMRRDVDGRMRPDAAAVATTRKPGYRAVRIVDPSSAVDNSAAAAAQRKRAFVLTFEGFCDLMCVLCGFKQPNVFVPFEERLAIFLRRSLLRPLTHTVAGLGALLAQSQSAQDAPGRDAAPSPDVPAVARAGRAGR